MKESCESDKDDKESSKIAALTSALLKTKDELIRWTLISDNDGDTALHLAVVREDNELCVYLSRLLVASGYSLNIRNKLMQTPLHLACILGNSILIKNLLELDGLQVDYKDRNGNACLHLAVMSKDKKCDATRTILDFIKQTGEDRTVANNKNIHGISALHIAASINKPEAIRLLVAHGAEIDQLDTKSGKSPLYIAVQERNWEAATALLELGADANRLTFFRDSPSQLASSANRRPFLQLISKYDTSSRSPTPNVGCRRNSRFDSDMVSQDSVGSNQMSTNEETPTYSEKNETGTDTPISPKTKSIMDPTSSSVSTSEPTTVKRETVSPKSSTPPAYPVAVVENTMIRPSESENGDSPTLADQMTLARVRQQLLAASLYNQHVNQADKNASWNPFVQPIVSGLQGFNLPQTYGLPQTSHTQINDQRVDNQKGVTAQTIRATEKACVTDESSAGTAVSERKQHRVTAFSAGGEPLDLSQVREGDTIRAASRDRANMLLECKMDIDRESRESVLNTENGQLNDMEDVQRKVKKEIAEENVNVPPGQRQVASPRVTEPVEPARNLAPNFLSNPSNAFAFVNHWLNVPTVGLLNHSAHFLPQTYGYIPAALHSTNQPLPLGSLDSVGLSQWVNLSMNMARAVDSLRHTSKSDNDYKSDRKRKVPNFTQDKYTAAVRDGDETVTTDNQTSQQSVIETPNKRCRLNEPNEGLHRSVSDDPGKRRPVDPEMLKTRLRRRNSAPSSGALSKLAQEENKKVAPVDLHSYAGCLPPQCLHLLQASGNLSISETTSKDHVANGTATERNEGDSSTAASTRVVSTLPHSSLSSKRSLDGRDNNSNFSLERGKTTSPVPARRTNATLSSSDVTRVKITQNGTKENQAGKINISAPVPIYSKTGYLSTADATPNDRAGLYQQYRYYQRAPAILPFVQNSRKFHSSERRTHETESDDDDQHIQTLQISDASSDEEDDIDVMQNKGPNEKQTFQGRQSSKMMESIGFGKGPWIALDNGTLPAFGVASSSRTNDTNLLSETRNCNIPTKMACSISKSFPQALNGLSRIYSSAKVFNSEKMPKRLHQKLTPEEFLPHHEITGPADDFSVKHLKLPMTPCTYKTKKHKCRGCLTPGNRRKQDERKLIGDIFQKSYRNCNFSGYHSTSPRCTPRLVFTSEVKLPKEIEGYSEKKGVSVITEFESRRSKATTRVGEIRHTEIPLTSAPEYSHKLFSFARSTSTKEGDNYNANSVRSTISQENTEGKSFNCTSSEEKSLFSSSAISYASSAIRARGSSTSSRSLDAKLEELRQKASERQERKVEVSEVNGDSGTPVSKNKMQTAAESVHFAERPSPPPLNSGLESRYRTTGSPFYDNDVGRFGKRNIAVIKPNQSVMDGHMMDKKTSGSTCPPKKRHINRYSPEFYSKPKVDAAVHDREVRSASPITHSPFVSTNVLINNEDHSLNVQWCSPDRSPTRRKQHGSKSRTILIHRVPLGQALRGTNTVTLERNARKYPRYVSSPGSNAVIVVESRMSDVAMDERDQRLEIEDLEISDDEGQAQ